MKDIARRAEIMGVAAHLAREADGSIRMALPAFVVGKGKKADTLYWAGSFKDGKVVHCWFPDAKVYLDQAAKLPESALPSETL